MEMERDLRKSLAFERYVRRFPPIVRYPYIAVVVPLRETPNAVVVTIVVTIAFVAGLTYLKLEYPGIGLSWALIAGAPLLMLFVCFLMGVAAAGEQFLRDRKGINVRQYRTRSSRRMGREQRWFGIFPAHAILFVVGLLLGMILGVLGSRLIVETIAGPSEEVRENPIFMVAGLFGVLIGVLTGMFLANVLFIRSMLWRIGWAKGRQRALRWVMWVCPYHPTSRWSRFEWWCYGGGHEELMAARRRVHATDAGK